MKRYFAYIRVSTVRQGERGSSLQEQRSAIEGFAMRHGLAIAAWFEEKETAAKQGRAVFTRMLARISKGDAEGLIIHKIDRSARNLKDWASLGDLIDAGVDVQFAHESMDLRSRGGRLAADIQAVVAADYIRNLRDEVKKGYYGRLKQGLYPLPAPAGYLDNGKGKPKTLDPLRAPLVRHAFELYATGRYGLKELRKEMARCGLTSQRTGEPLSLTGISTVLNNPFYFGIIKIRRTGEFFSGKHEPLIPKSLFDRVQAILKGKLVRRTVKHDFLFRRLVRCAACGYHLIGELHKGRYRYYRCHECTGTIVREEMLDHVVQQTFRLLEWNDPEQRAARALAERHRRAADQSADMQRATLLMRRAGIEERLTRLTDAFLDGAVDKATFERRKHSLLLADRELEEQTDGINSAMSPAETALEYLELGNMALYRYKTAFPEEKREIVEKLTSNFEVQAKQPLFTLKSPFQEVSNWRKSLNGAPHAGSPRIRARELFTIALHVAEEERNGVAEAKKENSKRIVA